MSRYVKEDGPTGRSVVEEFQGLYSIGDPNKFFTI